MISTACSMAADAASRFSATRYLALKVQTKLT
jgi:hypothetical protein